MDCVQPYYTVVDKETLNCYLTEASLLTVGGKFLPNLSTVAVKPYIFFLLLTDWCG